MAQKFANAARAVLASSIVSGDTTITISSGGSLFPEIASPDFARAVLQDESGIEIVLITAHTASANSFTVTRAQESTTARSFAAGSIFGIRVTAADMTGITTLGTGVSTFLATPSSANLRTALTDETGTGSAVFATSPTLVTPVLGTPSSGTLTSCTGLPISSGVSGLGTGVATALAVNVGSAGAPVVNGGALGTPSSGTLTSATGLPISTGVSGLGTGVATALAVNVGSAGAPVVNGGALGTPSSGTLTSATGLPLTTGVTGILPAANGGTGIANNAAMTVTGSGNFAYTRTLTGTTNVTFPTTGTLATLAGTETLTNKTLTAPTLSGTVTGGDGLLTRVMLQDTGWDYYDSTTTNALDYVNGSYQRWAPNTGAQTLSITNFPPSGALGELLIEGVNLGAATITWPTINWIKSDGTTTTTFSSNGVTLRASGVDFVFLWTRDAGTTIYGKVVR